MVDVFSDKLEMRHTIDFRNRLHLDKPTIVLLRVHELGDNDNNVVNVKHIAKLMSQGWGFYLPSGLFTMGNNHLPGGVSTDD